MDDVKMFLFSRWLATCYADVQMDDNNRVCGDVGFDSDNTLSLLNKKDGFWYLEQIQHFNNIVYPNYIKNGSVSETEEFLKKS